ncbi:MAG: hypothetical protein VX730_03540 [Pseudomonadota bacterium]|nr:hypothetical protein [Pseudomonadota bacterium]
MKKILILAVIVAAVVAYMIMEKKEEVVVVTPELAAPVVEDTSGDTSVTVDAVEDTASMDEDMGDAPSMVDTSTLEASLTEFVDAVSETLQP